MQINLDKQYLGTVFVSKKNVNVVCLFTGTNFPEAKERPPRDDLFTGTNFPEAKERPPRDDRDDGAGNLLLVSLLAISNNLSYLSWLSPPTLA